MRSPLKLRSHFHGTGKALLITKLLGFDSIYTDSQRFYSRQEGVKMPWLGRSNVKGSFIPYTFATNPKFHLYVVGGVLVYFAQPFHAKKAGKNKNLQKSIVQWRSKFNYPFVLAILQHEISFRFLITEKLRLRYKITVNNLQSIKFCPTFLLSERIADHLP